MRADGAAGKAPFGDDRAQHEPTSEIRNINMPGQPMARTAYHPDFAGKVIYPATWRDLEWLVQRSAPVAALSHVWTGSDPSTSPS